MTENLVRCEPCCGMGYKGRQRPAGWKIETCRACGGRGEKPPRKPRAKLVQCDECGQSYKGEALPLHTFCGKRYPGSPESEFEVHEGAPSWHQQRAGHISAGVTTGFSTRAAADEHADRLRANHPGIPVFVREVAKS